MALDNTPDLHAFDATTAAFEADVLEASMQVPVLLDFWAPWCEPCKALSPILEKLAAEYNGAFVLARVDVDQEPEIGTAFQVRSIPTVFLVKDGQPLDGFPGALPETQVRAFLKHHGIEPAAAPVVEAPADVAGEVRDPVAEVARLRADVAAAPENDALRLDLALALLDTGDTIESEHLLDGLPANLSTDDRAIRTRARLAFAALLPGAPSVDALQASIAADPADLRARHLLGVRLVTGGEAAAGLEQFLEILRRDKAFGDNLARRALIDAFRIIEDDEIVGRYRRAMASLLLV